MIMNKYLLSLVFSAVIALPMMTSAKPVDEKLIKEYIEVINMKQTEANMINHTVVRIVEAQPKLAGKEDKLKEAFKELYESFELESFVKKIMTEKFSEEEIKELVKFYKTELGQKTVNLATEIGSKVTDICQSKIQANASKINELLESVAKTK